MKNPKIIVDDQEFLIYKKEVNQTTWMCNHYFNKRAVRCKVKIVTAGRVVTVYGSHTHAPVWKQKFHNMLSQSVTIIRHP